MKQRSSLLLLVTATLMAVLFALACTENAATPDESDDSQSSSSKEVSSNSDDPDEDPGDSSSSSKGKSRSSSSSEESEDGDEPGDSSASDSPSSSSKARSSSSKTSSSSSVKADAGESSSSQVQATTCGNYVGEIPLDGVPSNPYTACAYYEGKCYTCKIDNEGEFEGVTNTCASEWVWDGTRIDDNLTQGYWYQQVTCSDEAPVPSSSSTSGGSSAKFSTKAEIDAYIDANWQRLGYSKRPDKVISLTIDDGPTSEITYKMLATLKEYEVTATFFVVGSNVRNNQAAARAIYEAGHELANHSDGMSPLPNKSNLEACSKAIKEITGSNPTLFRAPNVDYGNDNTLYNTCRELGLPLIDVSVWSHDYDNGVDANKLRDNVLGASQSGSIINCHEYDKTASMFPDIIKGLRDKGFWFLPLEQMAIYRGVKLEAGKKYNNF
jgi:peptidoglycan/xylan/chitin deacetylase (PgdA/CDA1 family)